MSLQSGWQRRILWRGRRRGRVSWWWAGCRLWRGWWLGGPGGVETGRPRHLSQQQVVKPPPLPPAPPTGDQQCQPQVMAARDYYRLNLSISDPRPQSKLARCTPTTSCTVSDPISNLLVFPASLVTRFMGAWVTARRVCLCPHHCPVTPDTRRWVESCLETRELKILRSRLQTLFVGKPPRNSSSSRFQCNHKVVSLDL